jgi:hypothetical protein
MIKRGAHPHAHGLALCHQLVLGHCAILRPKIKINMTNDVGFRPDIASCPRLVKI